MGLNTAQNRESEVYFFFLDNHCDMVLQGSQFLNFLLIRLYI